MLTLAWVGRCRAHEVKSMRLRPPIASPLRAGSSTRRRLLDSARTLFSQQGFAATSMSQVEDQSALALSGIYNQFSSKEALFQAVLVEDGLDLAGRLRADTGRADPPRSGARATSGAQDTAFQKLILIELVEFQGKHLPMLRDRLPQKRSALLGLAVAYHLTIHLLTGLGPAEARSTISQKALADVFLQRLHEPE